MFIKETEKIYQQFLVVTGNDKVAASNLAAATVMCIGMRPTPSMIDEAFNETAESYMQKVVGGNTLGDKPEENVQPEQPDGEEKGE